MYLSIEMGRKPVAYNNSSRSNKGIKRAKIEMALDTSTNYGANPEGLTWYSSLDTTSQYVIMSDTGTLQYTSAGSAKPVMWGTNDTTDAKLLQTINGLPDRFNQTPFTTIGDAVSWMMTTGKYFIVDNAATSNIITDGLVLRLDPGMIGSYPLTGNYIYGLASDYVGTFTNGPTWSSNNGGIIQFDGTNDYISLNSAVQITHNNPWTSSVWVYLDTYNESPFGYYNNSSTPGWYYFRRDVDASSNTRVRLYIREQRDTGWSWLSLYPFGSTYRTPATTDGYWLNQWINVVLSKDSNRTYRCYINGVYKAGITRSAAYLNNGLSVNAIGVSYGSLFFNGNIGPVSIYNKALNDAEVLQNYNAQKSRFGL